MPIPEVITYPLPAGFLLAGGQAGAAQTNTATLTPASGKTAFITGFQVSGTGATGASTIAITLTGILGGTRTFYLPIPAGAAVGATPLIVNFPYGVPGSAVDQAIAVVVPTFGAGNLNAAVFAQGYWQ